MSVSEKRKLRIAMVCDPIGDYIMGSGVSTLRFAERLQNNGHTVIFIAARSPIRTKRIDETNGMRTYRFFSMLLPKSEKKFYLAFPRVRALKEIFKRERIDVVHLLVPTPASIIASRAAKSLGIKIVSHSHTQPENLFLHLPFESIRVVLNRAFDWYMSQLYRRADAIVYPSQFARDLMNHINHHAPNMVISNGVDLQKFKYVDATNFLRKFDLRDDADYILFAGRLHPEKNVATLINAVPHIVSQHANAHVLIVGDGHMSASLKKLSEKIGAHTAVSFLGQVSDDDLLAAYNASGIFVLPSLAELEGMVVLEAMACGKPIVIANSPFSASPYFVNKNGFLFEPENHKDLAVQVLSLLKNKQLRADMGKQSLENVQSFDITQSVNTLENLYYSLIESA